MSEDGSELGEDAPTEDSSAVYGELPRRFVELSGQQGLLDVPAAPEEWLARAARLARALEPRAHCVDDVTAAELERRLSRAVSVAYSQAGAAGAALALDTLPRFAALLRSGYWIHGTGSWALDGILRDSALRPGGDGYTGEVALTGIEQPEVFVCLARSVVALYAAATFAHTNADSTGAELTISAVRAGHVPLAAFVSVLLFAQGEPRLTEEWLDKARSLVRYRTLEMEQALCAAFDEVLERAARDALPGDGRQYSRRLGPPADHATAVNNALAAVVMRMARASRLPSTPAADRLRRGVLAHAPALRARLLCALPEDDAARTAEKARILEALKAQFPVLLAIDSTGLSCRADPAYAWTDERLVGSPIPLSAVRAVYAPLVRHAALAGRLGAGVELLPLEDFEVMRLVAEGIANG